MWAKGPHCLLNKNIEFAFVIMELCEKILGIQGSSAHDLEKVIVGKTIASVMNAWPRQSLTHRRSSCRHYMRRNEIAETFGTQGARLSLHGHKDLTWPCRSFLNLTLLQPVGHLPSSGPTLVLRYSVPPLTPGARAVVRKV